MSADIARVLPCTCERTAEFIAENGHLDRCLTWLRDPVARLVDGAVARERARWGVGIASDAA